MLNFKFLSLLLGAYLFYAAYPETVAHSHVLYLKLGQIKNYSLRKLCFESWSLSIGTDLEFSHLS